MANRITTLAAPSPAIRFIGGDDESDESVESDWLVDVRVGVDVDVAVLDIDVDHVETDHPETVDDTDVDTHAGPVEAGFGLAVSAQSPSLPQASNLPSQHHFHSREGELLGTPRTVRWGGRGWLTLASTCSARTYGLALGRDVAVCLRWSPALTGLGEGKSVRYLHRRP